MIFDFFQHSQEVRKLLDQIKELQQELDESRLIAQDASEEVGKLRKQADDAEQQAEAAVKAQSLLHDIESNFFSRFNDICRSSDCDCYYILFT